MEQAGIVGGQPPKSNTFENAKYMLIMVICFGVIIYFSFRLLQKKVENESSSEI